MAWVSFGEAIVWWRRFQLKVFMGLAPKEADSEYCSHIFEFLSLAFAGIGSQVNNFVSTSLSASTTPAKDPPSLQRRFLLAVLGHPAHPFPSSGTFRTLLGELGGGRHRNRALLLCNYICLK
jgi:hypothetical protein